MDMQLGKTSEVTQWAGNFNALNMLSFHINHLFYFIKWVIQFLISHLIEADLLAY